MWVEELSMVVYFAGQVRVIFIGRLEDNLQLLAEIPLVYAISEPTLEPFVSLCVAK